VGPIWTKLGDLRYGTFAVGTIWKVRKPCLLWTGFRYRMSERQNGNFTIRHPGSGEILFFYCHVIVLVIYRDATLIEIGFQGTKLAVGTCLCISSASYREILQHCQRSCSSGKPGHHTVILSREKALHYRYKMHDEACWFARREVGIPRETTVFFWSAYLKVVLHRKWTPPRKTKTYKLLQTF